MKFQLKRQKFSKHKYALEKQKYFRFLGTGPNVTVVDTPGFKDTEDAEFIDEMMNVLGDEVHIVPKS